MPEEFKEKVILLYKMYYKEYNFKSSKEIKYFDDCTVENVLNNSEEHQKWEEKFEKVKKVETQFMNLKIAKKLCHNRELIRQKFLKKKGIIK